MLGARAQLVSIAQSELDEAIEKFYSNNGNANPLASEILAHLQALASAILDNPKGLPSESLESFVREREHFKHRRSSNARAARSMARSRAKATE